jgi:hypothetical protein
MSFAANLWSGDRAFNSRAQTEGGSRMSQKGATPGRRSRCPLCGLELQIMAGDEAPVLAYDFPEWSRLCKLSACGGPSMCLALTTGPAAAARSPALGSAQDVSELGRVKARL